MRGKSEACCLKRLKALRLILAAAAVFFWSLLVPGPVRALASDDNALVSLGIETPDAEVTPEFSYDNWVYEVTVPAGTEKLELSPVASSPTARSVEVEGQEIGADGTAMVLITVTAENGSPFTYQLNVTADGPGAAPETEAPTEPVTEKVTEKAEEKPRETEPETEDTTYVKVPKDTVDQAERTIRDLQGEITTYRDTVNLYTKIMYGLIAACVVLLFLVVNLAVRRHELKNEVKSYRSLGYSPAGGKKKGKKGGSGKGGASGKGGSGTGYPGTGPAARGGQAPYPGAGSQGGNAQQAYPGGGAPQGGRNAGPAAGQADGNTPAEAQARENAIRQEPQGAYYEKAPFNVTPQTSSRNYPGGGNGPAPQAPAAAENMASPAAQPGAAEQTAEKAGAPSGGAGNSGQPGSAQQPVSGQPGSAPEEAGGQKGSAQEPSGGQKADGQKDGGRKGGSQKKDGGSRGGSQKGGRGNSRKDVEINMVDL